jgi:predicted nucleotidyltransferase
MKTSNSDTALRDLTEVRRIVLEGLEGHATRVYLFGSHARGTAHRTSDIDVAILPLEPIPPWILSVLRGELEESHVPYRVDLVDLSMADPGLPRTRYTGRDRMERTRERLALAQRALGTLEELVAVQPASAREATL